MTAVTHDDAVKAPSARNDATQRGLPRAVTIPVTLASVVVFYALVTHGSFNPLYEQIQPGFAGEFFRAQAHAMLHGHLNVAPAQIPLECWVHHGRCYGYFGVTPRLLRVPFLPLLDAADRGATSIYMTAALTLAVGSALGILSWALARVQRTPLVTFLGAVLAVSLGPASVLTMIARPAVYEEAIAWSVAFALFGVYCFLRWWSTQRWIWAAVLVVSLTLSTNARPTTVPLGAVLGAGIVISALLRRLEGGRTRRTLLVGALTIVIPVAGCLGIYWLKFDSLVPSSLLNRQIGGPGAQPGWLAIRRVDHNSLQGLRFVPTALMAYLRPDGVALTSAFPFVAPRFGPAAGIHVLGIPPGGIYVEPFSTLPDDMPLAIIVVIAGTVYGVRRGLRAGSPRTAAADLLRSPMTYALVGTAASFGVMTSQGVITNRFLGDTFPFMVVAVAIAARTLAPPVARLSGRRAAVLVGGVALIVLWSLLVDLGLEYQTWWHTTV